jgi:TPR repeat protein
VRSIAAVLSYNLSIDYLLGKRVRKNLRTAFLLNRRSARLGVHDAQLAMGWFYHNGFGVGRDLVKASRWYKIAARRGDAKAWFSLGQLAFDRGDFLHAATWFRKAARRQHARSIYYLGRLHLDGLGVEQNTRKGARFLRTAVGLGVPAAKRLLDSARFKTLMTARPNRHWTRRRRDTVRRGSVPRR